MSASISSPRTPLARTAITSVFWALFTPCLLLAQEETDSDVVLMDAFIAAAEDDVYEVLPTRESTLVFGTSRDLSETPHSVTLIESALTDLYGIRTVNDFVAVTAGSFTGNYCGVPGALDVRGERADNFFRGFRRIENRGNFPTPIASTDYVEIIKVRRLPFTAAAKSAASLTSSPKPLKVRPPSSSIPRKVS
ncbi:MAG: hypothetical protein J6386_16655 [Candidatus Synoicihabitans palmerolidicus]|nr:hypothetical protein [Candidatus Synoicihabitans palmerolidicus]